jgi:hypothetical protein
MNQSDRYDALLSWASEVGSCSWERWKEACAALELEPNEAARAVSQLGHLEFSWGEDCFACVPTTLVPIPGLDGQLLLTGARPVSERQRLRNCALAGDLEVDVSEPIAQLGGAGPSTIMVECDPDQAEAFAEAAGIVFESSPDLLAASLPDLTLELVGEIRSPDLRFPHCRIDHQTLLPLWGQETADGDEGLWLVYGYRRAEHYLRRDGQWWYLPIREYGPFLAAPTDVYPRLLDYEEANWLLHTRSRAPLPPLQARALTLCSGRLPLMKPLGGEREETYVNIDPRTARDIARSLGVELREEVEA